jgi:hypothetical protein
LYFLNILELIFGGIIAILTVSYIDTDVKHCRAVLKNHLTSSL